MHHPNLPLNTKYISFQPLNFQRRSIYFVTAIFLFLFVILIAPLSSVSAQGCTWNVEGSGNVTCNFDAVPDDVINISCTGCSGTLFSYGWELYDSRGNRIKTTAGRYRIRQSGHYYVVGSYDFSNTTSGEVCGYEIDGCGYDAAGNYACTQNYVCSQDANSNSVPTTGTISINIEWVSQGYRTPTPSPATSTPFPTSTPVPSNSQTGGLSSSGAFFAFGGVLVFVVSIIPFVWILSS